MSIKRLFVEKKKGFDIEAQGLFAEFSGNLLIRGLEGVRVINRYDVDGLSDEELDRAQSVVFAEPPVDNVYNEEMSFEADETVICTEFLPGQFDQRADSAALCAQILTQGEKPLVRVAKLIVIKGNVESSDIERIKKYLINPVESREASLEKPNTLLDAANVPDDVKIAQGFISSDDEKLAALAKEMGFAMDLDDLKFCQKYFADTEHRDPTYTEMRLIDTYWSDHCRHTTFSTVLDSVEFEKGAEVIEEAYKEYIAEREKLGRKKDICMMDIATLAVKALKAQGKLKEIDESEEINACSINVTANVNGRDEEWLVMFKNETHNHPTEIEPFGGAATCLGGAIRDPLSGRSYVYQAMRVTGCGDVRAKVEDTIEGKLPQRKISRTAARGYSSYGNQIGLATGQVAEIYDEGYVAKHMEIGAVIGAVQKDHVVRETPQAGDIVILLGGRTGRDGCGGATGSSKAHDAQSLETCGAEVQKGNPPEERKLQRLFRSGEVTRMIKRCNDFGAGGVSVAIGELAPGLSIDLDKVPKKYDGLDGTELAISESQERMAVVVRAQDGEKFIKAANGENLEATVVAEVTENPRLVMRWRGKVIADISREFLDTNGASKHAKVSVSAPPEDIFDKEKASDTKEKWLNVLSSLPVCSQKGLVEMFDSSIGAATLLMPYGGVNQTTPVDGMAAKLPVDGETDTATIMAYGFDPALSRKSPFYGAVYAVISSVAKVVALGGDYTKIYLTFQEYFEKLGADPKRWGKPVSALLGAFWAQMRLGLGAIGGKDSMSGSFENLDVPPTLVSFAVAPEKVKNVISPEFKSAGNRIYLYELKRSENGLPDFACLDAIYKDIHENIVSGKIVSATALTNGGIAAAVSKACFGNALGAKLNVNEDELFDEKYGSIIVEAKDALSAREIGEITNDEVIEAGGVKIALEDALDAWENTLEGIFPTVTLGGSDESDYAYSKKSITVAKEKCARPRVFIPAFPGTNCELDSARAFERAGADPDVCIFNNLSPSHVEASLAEFARRINESQIIMLPGGFSGGDEPDGSGKFIAAAFRNPRVMEATMKLIREREGLMLGICNGFQALIKLGLVPYGEIREITEESPTLTFNKIGRHVSRMVYTAVTSSLSPWLAKTSLGDVHSIAVSHGEGRFVASDAMLEELKANGQIATRYTDFVGKPQSAIEFNPNGSTFAIEGITDKTGRIFGKMGHSERLSANTYKNISGNKDQKLFEAGVEYFR